MTHPYSARYITAFDYFRTAIEENYGFIPVYGDEFEVTFKSFYKFIDNDMETKYFLKNESKKMIKY
jgi:hypothetical protein